jgi:probable RNA-binding protein EIF1AD
MSGVGRRSQYRKHLTGTLLNELPVPDFSCGERIAKVYGSKGGNRFDVLLADPPEILSPASATVVIQCATNKNDNLEDERVPQLAMLPNKFHKLVWIKRNDFVIVRGSLEQSAVSKVESSSGVRYMITHVLYKDQVKHLKDEGLWPINDPCFSDPKSQEELTMTYNEVKSDGDIEESTDNILSDGYSTEEDTSQDHDEYLINTNRLARIRIVDSDDDED